MNSQNSVPPAEFVGGFGFINWVFLLVLFIILFPLLRRILALYQKANADARKQAQATSADSGAAVASQQALEPGKE